MENIQEDFINNINEYTINDIIIKLNEKFETKIKSQNNVIESLNTQIESLNTQIKSQNDVNESQNTQIISLNNGLNEVKENLNLLWSYLSLLANSIDIFKSIPFYLYKYMKLEGGFDNYTKLIELIKYLQQNQNKYEIGDEILLKYLRLENFLLKMFNFILHRKFNFNNLNNYDEINFIPKNNFEDCFDNLIIFVESIVNKKDIQLAIEETINEIKNDTSINDLLKYEDGQLFRKINSNYVPTITKEEIIKVKDFLKGIKIGDKEFVSLCEAKVWNNLEDVKKSVLFFKGQKLDDDNINVNDNNNADDFGDDN